jgi:hypothetical protein
VDRPRSLPVSAFMCLCVAFVCASTVPVFAQGDMTCLFNPSLCQAPVPQSTTTTTTTSPPPRKVVLMTSGLLTLAEFTVNSDVSDPYPGKVEIQGDSHVGAVFYSEPGLRGTCMAFRGPVMMTWPPPGWEPRTMIRSVLIADIENFATGCSGMWVFENTDYKGRGYFFTITQKPWNLSPRTWGAWPTLGSARPIGVPATYVITAPDDQPPCSTIRTPTPDLRTLAIGDQGVYLANRPAGCHSSGGPVVTLYEAWNYQGRTMPIESDVPSLPHYANVASSLKHHLPSQPVSLYSGANYSGRCSTVSADVPQLNPLPVGNDQVASVRLAPCPNFATRATLYEAWDYGGRAVDIENDIPDLAAINFDDVTSGVRMSGGNVAAVYTQRNYTGWCSTIQADVPRMNDRLVGNDTVSSVKLGQRCPVPEQGNWPASFDGLSFVGMGPYEWVNGPTIASLTDAVQGATGGGVTQYVCRAWYNDGFHPGKYFNGRCNFGWGGKEVSVTTNYSILVNRQPFLGQFMKVSWEAKSPLPGFASAGANSPTMRICRAMMNDGGHHLGKEWSNNCNVGFGGVEVTMPSYQVLNLTWDKAAFLSNY